MIQVIKRGTDCWELTRVTREHDAAGGDQVSEYELIGRIVKVDALYYAESPDWTEFGFEWRRQARGYLHPKGARAAILNPREELKQ